MKFIKLPIPYEDVILICLSIITFIVFISILISSYVDMYKNDIRKIQGRNIDEYKNTIEKLLKPKVFLPRVFDSASAAKWLGHELPIKKYRELYKLYLKGVPDKYDTQGNKIEGVEPSPDLAIKYASLVLGDKHHTDQDLINLAKIYHYGMHKFEPNIEKAEIIYQQLQERARSPAGLVEANEGLKAIQDMRVRQWLNLPYTNPQPISADWGQQNPQQRLNRHGFQALQPHFPDTIATITWDDFTIDNDIDNRIDIPLQLVDNLGDNLIFDPDIVDTPEHDDPHNTHNSQVLSTIRNSLKRLKKSTTINTDEETTISEIRNYIRSLPQQNSKTADALKSLDRVSKGNKALLNTGMSERQALNLVWNRINNSSRDPNVLKENLLDELADMQEHGHTVCSTGRITRIVDTLNVVDPEVTIKPTYAVNEEMMGRASKIREELLEKQPENLRKQLQKGTAPNQEAYDKEEKATILQTLQKEYVEDNEILSKEKFDLETGKWIDMI